MLRFYLTGMAPVVKRLPSKHKALSSNSITAKKFFILHLNLLKNKIA
jgi:hypothetical protein